MKYLKTHDAKCNGCLICTQVCSELYFKENDPGKSCVQVKPAGKGKKKFTLNACDQCRKCVAECPTLALTVNKQGVVILNKTLCINCLACVAVCPNDSMRTHPGLLAPFKCIACGACAKKCPTKALEIVTEEK